MELVQGVYWKTAGLSDVKCMLPPVVRDRATIGGPASIFAVKEVWSKAEVMQSVINGENFVNMIVARVQAVKL